jgi:hypothetical protein
MLSFVFLAWLSAPLCRDFMTLIVETAERVLQSMLHCLCFSISAFGTEASRMGALMHTASSSGASAVPGLQPI